ncbi:hypothetical protein J27TS7_04330 [Paenibacillus dendritiformis]|nr:hypothetical protein J27TS7_04330 [Paenibacillus dendritiformis]
MLKGFFVLRTLKRRTEAEQQKEAGPKRSGFTKVSRCSGLFEQPLQKEMDVRDGNTTVKHCENESDEGARGEAGHGYGV